MVLSYGTMLSSYGWHWRKESRVGVKRNTNKALRIVCIHFCLKPITYNTKFQFQYVRNSIFWTHGKNKGIDDCLYFFIESHCIKILVKILAYFPDKIKRNKWVLLFSFYGARIRYQSLTSGIFAESLPSLISETKQRVTCVNNKVLPSISAVSW